MDNLKSIYLTNTGRIARMPYFLFSLGLIVIAVVLTFILAMILGQFGLLVTYILLLIPSYNLMAKRLQDFDKPGNWAIGVIALGILAGFLALVLPTFSGLVSLLQLLLMLLILFVPGTNGENRYGPQPT